MPSFQLMAEIARPFAGKVSTRTWSAFYNIHHIHHMQNLCYIYNVFSLKTALNYRLEGS